MDVGLLDEGLRSLRSLLGVEWTAEVSDRPSSGADALVDVRSPDQQSVALLVELKSSVTPRLIADVLMPKRELIGLIDGIGGLLVMGPWISPRSQDMLRDAGINYLDLTGNVSVRSSRPGIAIYTQGAAKAPRRAQAARETTTLGGVRAGRLVRTLVDVAPPYRASALADRTGLSLSYVSKLLDILDEQLLIRRDGRLIVDVDWANLLRSRAAHLNLLKNHSYVGAIAPNGIPAALASLSDFARRNSESAIVLTGSFAARAIAPVAIGGQLMIYAADPGTVATSLGLFAVNEGADVLLLRANDDLVFEGHRVVDGVPHVALSQLALDCLSGTGRMPAEGEAVISFMTAHEPDWRIGAE